MSAARAAAPRPATVSLHPRPPFRLAATAWTLRRRAGNPIDRWDGAAYARTFAFDDGEADVAVTQSGTARRPRLDVVIASRSAVADSELAALVARTLGIGVDLRTFYALARADERLAPLAERFRGVKPPRFPTVFEALVNAVACQQFSLTVGIRLIGRLARLAHGQASTAREDAPIAFPTPAQVARVGTPSMQRSGFSRQKIASLQAIARVAMTGELDAERFAALDDDAALERLRALPGVGRWSAEYVLLRGLGRLNVFPGDDVGARNNLERWLGLRKSLDYDGVRRIVRRWQPYAGLVYFHLLLNQLAEGGLLP